MVTAIKTTQSLPEGPEIPFLVSGLPLGVGFLLLARQPVEPPRGIEQLRAPGAVVVVVAPARLGGLPGQRVVLPDRLGEERVVIGFDPVVEGGIALGTALDEALPTRTLKLTLDVLHAVVDARQSTRVANAHVATLGSRCLDHRDTLPAPRDEARIFALEPVLHRDVAGVA